MLGVRLSSRREGTDRVDSARERRIGCAQVGERGVGVEAEAGRRRRTSAALCRRRAAPSIASSAQLGRHAAVGGKTAQPAAGGEHAMAGHDDRERVASERLAHRARRAAARRGAPRSRRRRASPGRDRARGLVDAAMKRRHELHVERTRRDRWPPRAAAPRFHRAPRRTAKGWRILPRVRQTSAQALLRIDVPSLGGAVFQ